MQCPRCQAAVPDSAIDCPACGVVLAKATAAGDRAVLRQYTASKTPIPAEPEKSSGMKWLVVLVVLAICGFGAWQWYTDDTESDLDRLAAEVHESGYAGGGALDRRGSRPMWGLLAKLGIAVGVAVAGYAKWKSSLSP